jgi:hypothetical protein
MERDDRMNARLERVYVENSVIGGYYDKIFRDATRKLFQQFKDGVYKPVISEHTLGELNDGAPEPLRR